MDKVKIKGLITGIGSLPHQDADKALDLIFKYCPQVPFWPQLPKRDTREGMVVQFMQKLPIPQRQDGDVLSATAFAYPSEEKRLEEFYKNIIEQNIDYFKITEDYACGLYKLRQRLETQPKLLENIEFIKCQITGPFTSAASIKDEYGVAYLHNPVFIQAFINGLIMKALWQIVFFKTFNKKMIMFVDEPYLSSFGSAYTPINRDDVIKGLTELTKGIKHEDVLIGVHCCGNTDWSIFTDVEGIDIINFDAFSFLERLVLYADNLKGFFKRGGMLCWGIVPTNEFSGKESADLLIDKIQEGVNALVNKGLDKDLVTENLFLSPACGLATLDIKKAEQILELLSRTQNKLFDKRI